MISERKPKLFESDRCKKFYNKIFQKLLKINNYKHCSRNSSIGAVFAERFDRTIGDLFKGQFLKTEFLLIALMY